ncbi:MAG: signal recognition particle-docking protein FtsY [Brevefilum fermentans]|jgi:fused signal recognition particle receptor|uniref:Signal recognition particle receptor FtsY n=1 Tax=Candidatus Brevifilum fermentans TaxID=1986204 RepID=A0A1Y6K452_9CHLR|nr:signal recognition particle-docking protein FtsY [Brevefilum fermentans]MDI9565724.1 signal recognition particle-docking protein FtsY [Chloroflexota bacterium]SMX54465.1 Signal recognition particle receptor FtsY [Brevefilum fermentans]
MSENLFNKWRVGLEKTRKVAFGRIANFLGTSELDDETWEDLEGLLIQADLGVETTLDVIDALKKRVRDEGLTTTGELDQALKDELIARLQEPILPDFSHKPTVIILVGVNGSGKTTSAAKLARRFQDEGKSALLVAADTYRAAAIDQLKVWAERVNVPMIAGQPGGDPGAAAFDGINAAVARKKDVVLIDTAGRLHTRYNLMEEIKKVHRVSGKALPGAPHATWLVLDATTGQNAFQQAKAFQDAVAIDGVILAKLDSSAKGGMAFAIKSQLNLPIIYAGLGEKITDLQPFDREAFVCGIIDRSLEKNNDD